MSSQRGGTIGPEVKSISQTLNGSGISNATSYLSSSPPSSSSTSSSISSASSLSPFGIEDILADGFGSAHRTSKKKVSCYTTSAWEPEHGGDHSMIRARRDLLDRINCHPYYRFARFTVGCAKTTFRSAAQSSKDELRPLTWQGAAELRPCTSLRISPYDGIGVESSPLINVAPLESRLFDTIPICGRNNPSKSPPTSNISRFDSPARSIHSAATPKIAGKISNSVARTSPPSNPMTRDDNPRKLPAWIYCTRYSDRPSSG